MKIVVGILFGGKSAEHEVSLQSANNIYHAIDREKFEPVLIGIDKSGRWHLNEAKQFLSDADNPALISLSNEGEVITLPPGNKGNLSPVNFQNQFNAVPLDVVFPVLHGPFGEDGTVQGFLKLADIPFVGTGVVSSAAGMDKDIMKRLFRDAGFPIGKFLTVKSSDKIPEYNDVTKTLGMPVFVKPANMGSSVGISKVHNEKEYDAAVKNAFLYDRKIIIEEFIQGREIECSVLGNENPITSVPGEVIPSHDFYSYDAKYLDTKGADIQIPANLDEETQRRVQELSVKVFQALDCEGLSRVDFFLKDSGELVVNEINTMPGFTKISMFPKMWEASGISYTELITRLIELAIQRYEKEQKLITSIKL
jgi:D-alanine-D-alanine ligase